MAKNNTATDKKMNTCEDCDHMHASDCGSCGMCSMDRYHGWGMSHAMCGRGGCGRWFFKFVVKVLVLVIVFSIGMAVGAAKVLRYGDSGLVGGPAGMMGLRGMMGSWIAGGSLEGRITAYGTITKVEGNRITFTDNGGKEGTVLSMTGTTIVFGRNVTTLSEIKAGQTLSAYGNLNAQSELEASWIGVK